MISTYAMPASRDLSLRRVHHEHPRNRCCPAEKPAAKKTSRKAVPQTGDQSANALAVVALGATALGAAVVMKKLNEL